MKKPQTLRKSLITSNALISLIPLLFIALFILLFMLQDKKREFMLRTDLLSRGIRSQIQLFLDQPQATLSMISKRLDRPTAANGNNITNLLNNYLQESGYFESIYLLDATGKVINAGLPAQRERYRHDILGIELGHKSEFKQVKSVGHVVWSDTFLSLASGTTSVTLYMPSGQRVLAADINLKSLEHFVAQLSNASVTTMVIDRNGAILFHPDEKLMGKSIMMNDIHLVAAALQGEEQTGQFSWRGKQYFGSTNNITTIGWVSLIAVPSTIFSSTLIIPLLITACGICSAIGLSLLLAYYRAKKFATPLTNVMLASSIIAQGDYSHSLPTCDFLELEQLTQSINQMATAIQHREGELRDNERKYRELVENTSNLVLRLDHNLTISYANHTITKLTGITVTDITGQPLKTCISATDWPHFESTLNEWISSFQDSGSLECTMINNHGESSHLLLSVNLHFGADGKILDLNIIGHDVTTRYRIEQQQKELDEKRQQSQKMELLGLMAGGVAHDLNNILSGIISLPEMILYKLDANDPLRAPLNMVKNSGERAAAVVADLLTIARGSAAVRQPNNINHMIKRYCEAPETLKLQELYPQVNLIVTTEPNLWPCSCSESHIEKTIMNLIINAFEAIKDHGEVHISTQNITAEHIGTLAADLTEGPYIAIHIQDSGSGISSADIDKIFEPFFSKKGLGRSGTGLGLAVAWNSIREHNGTILVKSSSAGTRFTILLPAEHETTTELIHINHTELKKGNGEKILVVDDEEILREIAHEMLSLLGYQVSCAASGEEALNLLITNRADLVLLDMQMDPGINGLETYTRIKKLNPEQKALIATGYSTSVDVEKTIQAGAAGFIKKPYNIEDLGKAIDEILNPTSKV